jgi:hypothetical protein
VKFGSASRRRLLAICLSNDVFLTQGTSDVGQTEPLPYAVLGICR